MNQNKGKTKYKRRRIIAGLVLGILLQLLPAPMQQVQAAQAWPPTAPGTTEMNKADSVVGIEEYDDPNNYTGWYTVTIKALDPEGNPVKDVYITMNSVDNKYQAGHGPNINGSNATRTDANGELLFRIYPSPLEYIAKVSKQGDWKAKDYEIGAIIKDFDTITIVLERDKKATPTPTTTPGNNGGNRDDSRPTPTPTPTPQPVTPGIPAKPDKVTKDEYVLPGPDNKTGTEDDVIVKPGRDDQGKNNSSMDKDGKVDLPDGGDVIYPSIPDDGDVKVIVPDGTKVNPDGSLILPDNNQEIEIILPGKDATLGTEDDIYVKPGLDENGKNNARIDETGKVELPDGGDLIYPSIPDKGDIKVTVPDGTKVKPDGTLILPDNNQEIEIILPGKDATLGTEDDIYVKPGLDENGKNNARIDETGKVELPDGGDLIYPSIPDKGDIKVTVPDGTKVKPDGTLILPKDNQEIEIILPGKDATLGTEDDIYVKPGLDKNGKNNAKIDITGKVELPDGGDAIFPSQPDMGKVKVQLPEGSTIDPQGNITIPKGTRKGYVLPGKDAELDTQDDVIVEPNFGKGQIDRSVLREDGSILLPDGGIVTYSDGTVIKVPGGTIVLADGTIIWPYGYKPFWECWFHWIELVVFIALLIPYIRRFHWLKKKRQEVQEMIKTGVLDSERLAQISQEQQTTGNMFYLIGGTSLAMVLLVSIAYVLIVGHCFVDIPGLIVLLVTIGVCFVWLYMRERQLRNMLEDRSREE